MFENHVISKRVMVFFSLFFAVAPSVSQAQWVDQEIVLRPGWNSIHLQVQPEPGDCEVVFADLPVESVWAWNRRFSSVQFVQDTSTLVPEQPEWLAYAPPDLAENFPTSLFTLHGGRAYLIKLSGDESIKWTIRGKPVVRPIDWMADSFNLVGFHVDTDSGPTFETFFAPSAAHASEPIYQLNASGHWERVANPVTEPIRPGIAYWVYCKGRSNYSGPLVVVTEQRAGMVYGRTLTEQTLKVRNDSLSIKTVTLRKNASGAAPNNEHPAYAGEVPLSYFKMNLAADEFDWVPLPDEPMPIDLGPGEEWAIRLAVRRADMADFTPAPGITEVLYQSLLEITDGAGSKCVVPVTAEGLQSYTPVSSGDALLHSLAGKLAHPRSGLWVGTAVINKVNEPAHVGAPTTPVPTATKFQFRLIIHVDHTGQARVLQKILQMWKDGTTKPDPEDPTKLIVDEPGRFVLLTDESLASSYSGAALRDGKPVGRRISTAAFSFSDPIPMTGTGDFGAGTFSCQIVLDYDDPINPFKHRYHPEHNNLDERFENKLPEGIESFTIHREIDLEFQSTDPDGLALAGWGDNQLGGLYRETITGLHRHTLHLAGTFRLHHASRIPVLNDGI